MEISQPTTAIRNFFNLRWALFLSLFLGIIIGGFNLPLWTWPLLVGVGILAWLILIHYQIALIGYIFILFASFDLLGYQPVITNPVRIYIADGILAFLFVVIIRMIVGNSRKNELANPISIILVVNFAFGILSVLISYNNDYQLNNILGDFRRIFLYPLSTICILPYVPKQGDGARLTRLFILSLSIITCIAIYRVGTGQTWDPEQFASVGDFRAIGYFTGIFAALGLSVFFAFSQVARGLLRFIAWSTCLVLIGVIMLSGYRFLWLLIFIAPFLVSILITRRVTKMVKVIISISLLIFLLVILGIVLSQLLPDWFELTLTKFQDKVINFDFTQDIRFYAWKTSLELFSQSPIWGVGIGHQFSFWGFNSLGNPHLFALTTHNSLLTILYQTGLIGIGLFLLIQIMISKYILKKIFKLAPVSRALLAGMYAGYLSMLGLSTFQPLLENPNAVVGFYLWVGIMIRFAQISSVNKGIK